MIRRLALPSILAFGLQVALLALLQQIAHSESPTGAATAIRCVNPTGTGGCFSAIQAAIDASSSGDRINVAAGVYTEHITMKDGVSIYGEGMFSTILDGGHSMAKAMVTFSGPISAGTVLSGVLISGGGDGSTTTFLLGGGLDIEYASPTIINALIFNNTALRGGGVFVNSGSPSFDQVLVWENRAEDGGGYYLQNDADVQIVGDIFDPTVASYGSVYSNTATDEGGGLFISPGVTVTLAGLRIVTNTASIGGGVCLVANPNQVVIGYNDIAFNKAQSHGGGLYAYNTTNLLIQSNYINFNISGGTGGGAAFSQSAGLLQGNLIGANIAGQHGGGVSVLNTSTGPTIRGNWFLLNLALASSGGGLNLQTGAAPLVDANTFDTNFANMGGGVYLFLAGPASITNNILARNSAVGAAGGIAIVESPAQLINNTIAENTSDGVYFSKAEGAVIANNIVYSNSGNGIEYSMVDNSSFNADYNDVFGNAVKNYEGLSAGANDLSVDPKFVATGTDLVAYYHIQATSPVSEAGSVTWAPERDIDGELRLAGGSVSMGADELPGAALTVIKTSNPDPVQAGSSLTYTIYVTNTGDVTLTATIIDDLPDQVTPNADLAWPATISAPGGVWTRQVVVDVDAGYSGMLTNVVRVTTLEGATGVYSETAGVVAPGIFIYLPLVVRGP